MTFSGGKLYYIYQNTEKDSASPGSLSAMNRRVLMKKLIVLAATFALLSGCSAAANSFGSTAGSVQTSAPESSAAGAGFRHRPFLQGTGSPVRRHHSLKRPPLTGYVRGGLTYSSENTDRKNAVCFPLLLLCALSACGLILLLSVRLSWAAQFGLLFQPSNLYVTLGMLGISFLTALIVPYIQMKHTTPVTLIRRNER